MLKTKEEITEWLHANTSLSDESEITINPDLTVDVDGSIKVQYFGMALSSTTFPVKFGEITGSFDCSSIKLSSLRGSPNQVNGDFDCGDNLLSSLEGAPQQVDGRFHCNWNQLTSLEGSPEKVGGVFDCSNNRLISLGGAPLEIGDSFACNSNELKNLDGAPRKIGFHFYCFINPLEALGVIDTHIGGEFMCNPFTEVENLDKFIDDEGKYTVKGQAFNNVVQERRLIREEKALLEAQLAKLVEPYDREKEGPLPSEKANKPRMKHKI